MGWFSRLFAKRPEQKVPPKSTGGGSKSGAVTNEGQPVIRVHMHADGQIEFNGRIIPFANFAGELKAANQPNAIMLYSRDNPQMDSVLGGAIVNNACKLGLAIGFPPEAKASIQAAMAAVEKAQQSKAGDGKGCV